MQDNYGHISTPKVIIINNIPDEDRLQGSYWESKNICTLAKRLGWDIANGDNGDFHGYKHLGKDLMMKVIQEVADNFDSSRNGMLIFFLFSHGGKDGTGEYLANGVSNVQIQSNT